MSNWYSKTEKVFEKMVETNKITFSTKQSFCFEKEDAFHFECF